MTLKERSTSPSASPSPSTTQTSPADFPAIGNDTNENDVWASDNSHPQPAKDEMLSDLPTMNRHHTTTGYREGLSTAKAKVMQAGFDAGYPLGAALALRVGPILGVLEGYRACPSVATVPGLRAVVERFHAGALRELAISKLLGDVDEERLVGWGGEGAAAPESVERVLQRWEGVVTGVYETREYTRKMQAEEQRTWHELRGMVEEAKASGDPMFKDDSSDEPPSSCLAVERGGAEEAGR